MKKYVLDASVILCFLLEENKNIEREIKTIFKATEKQRVQLFSCYLLPVEVGNGLRFTLKEEAQAEEVFAQFLKLPIEYFRLNELHYQKVLSLSYLYKTSFYDTSYHLLAKVLKMKFLTCDKEYYRQARNFGDIELLA